ncbi:pentapeptide repeat-containing protein [Nocardia nepalensis]|uniref:pentapeptide repeat-containing protein n=1 Tax=Nocardia nepalensis TaxID=3375448 RepID=UPI003B685616
MRRARESTPDQGGERRGRIPWRGIGLFLVILVVVVALIGGIIFFFRYQQSWKDLTPGQATLLASFGAIIAGSLALCGAWVTRRGAERNTRDQISADMSRLTKQLGEQATQLEAQLDAAKKSTQDQISADKDRLAEQLEAQAEHLELQLAEQGKQLSETRKLETARDLRTRYTTVAEQLAHHATAVRLAGVYALAALADDWHAFGNDSERQVCIDLLCAYLRDLRTETDDDRKVRSALVKTIHLHTMYSSDNELPENGWSKCKLDLSGADLRRVRLEKTVLFDPNLDDCNLTGAVLVGVKLSHAHMRRVDLRGAMLNFAHLRQVDLTDAIIDERTDLTGIQYEETRWPDTFEPPPSNQP